MAHAHDSFLVTGPVPVPCPQTPKAVRGAVGRCPRDPGCPQGPGLESLQLQSSFPHPPALAQPLSPVWSTRTVDPTPPRTLWEFSVIEMSQINQAGLGKLLKSQKVQFLMQTSVLSSSILIRRGWEIGGKETETGGGQQGPKYLEQPSLS